MNFRDSLFWFCLLSTGIMLSKRKHRQTGLLVIALSFLMILLSIVHREPSLAVKGMRTERGN